jgi:hypothetical protein
LDPVYWGEAVIGAVQLQAAIVAKLKLIPGLVSLLGSASKIVSDATIAPYRTIEEAIYTALDPPFVMVVCDGGSGPGRDGMSTRTHRFRLVIRTSTASSSPRPQQIIDAILGGKATGDAAIWQYEDIMSGASAPAAIVYDRVSLVVDYSTAATIEYWQIAFEVFEKGVS